MSASKNRTARENQAVHDRWAAEARKVIHLLTYVTRMQEKHPEIEWPELPDTYDEVTWMFVG